VANIVLVHGAFEGGWIWRRVAARLRRKGHDVFTPTLTGCGARHHLLTRKVGLSTHVSDVVGTLTWEGLNDVFLVGHSYGGTVVTVAADREPARIREVVYLDASAPRAGQNSTGAFAEGTEAVLADMVGDDWLLPPIPLDSVGITAAEDVAWVEPLRRAHPAQTLYEPVQLDNPTSYRRCYIRHTQNEVMVKLFGVDPLAPFAERAKEEGWAYEEISAPHDAMVTHPDEVAAALHARATAS
jgi:pimeloyl-ACP methyl ester carboxylesterase